MKSKLEQTLNQLNHLDNERTTLVIYNPNSMEIMLRQHGSITVRLGHLVGYIEPYKRTGILLPEDLTYIKNTLRYILDTKSTILVAPKKGGYRIWQAGDITYSSTPRFLTDINFYSVTNPILLWYWKLKSEEIRLLFRTLNPA